MAWEIPVLHEFEKEILEPLVSYARDLVEERSGEGVDARDLVDRAVADAIDTRLIYTADQLACVQEYGHTREAFDGVYEELFADVADRLDAELEEAR